MNTQNLAHVNWNFTPFPIIFEWTIPSFTDLINEAFGSPEFFLEAMFGVFHFKSLQFCIKLIPYNNGRYCENILFDLILENQSNFIPIVLFEIKAFENEAYQETKIGKHQLKIENF